METASEGMESSDCGEGSKGIQHSEMNTVKIDKGQAKEEFIVSETKQNTETCRAIRMKKVEKVQKDSHQHS